MSPDRTRDRILAVALGAACLWTLTIPVSIAVAEAALWLSAVLWLVVWLRREIASDPTPVAPAVPGPAGDVVALVGAPTIAFWGLSLAAATFSRDRLASLWELREAFLFAAPFVAYVAFWKEKHRRTGVFLFTAGVAVAVVWGIVETIGAVRGGAPLLASRPDGPLGHYMTYSGLLMVALPVLLTVGPPLALRLTARLVAAGAVAVIGVTMTRSAWLGTLAVITVYLVTARARRRRPSEATRSRIARVATAVVFVLIVAVLVLSLVGRAPLVERGASIFSLSNPTNVDRLAMAVTGLRIIAHYPLLGVGPGIVGGIYPAWRVPWGINETNPHLHNNLIQIAAERGLLGLAAWLWMMAAFVVGAWRVLRHAGPYGEGGAEARAALAALAGFLTMGMFEYNFSDSEVLMALLFVLGLPFAASAGLRAPGSASLRD